LASIGILIWVRTNGWVSTGGGWFQLGKIHDLSVLIIVGHGGGWGAVVYGFGLIGW